MGGQGWKNLIELTRPIFIPLLIIFLAFSSFDGSILNSALIREVFVVGLASLIFSSLIFPTFKPSQNSPPSRAG